MNVLYVIIQCPGGMPEPVKVNDLNVNRPRTIRAESSDR